MNFMSVYSTIRLYCKDCFAFSKNIVNRLIGLFKGSVVGMNISDVALKARASTTLSISAKAAKLAEKGLDVINFSAGEPDFDTPDFIKEAAIDAINNNFTKYTPYEGILELRQAVAADLKAQCGIKYSADQIVISNGSKHAVKNAFAAILNPGDEVIVPAPYWNSYIDIINMLYGVPVVVKTKMQNSFKITAEELENAYTEKTKAIIINSPNNPTGMVYSRDELEMIADFVVKHDIFVISDEIYKNLIYSKKLQHTSIASLGKEIYEHTIVVDGLSKSYSMTGWRVGYTASPKKIAKAIANIQSNSTSNVNSIAQKAALAALTGDQSCVKDMLREFQHRRDYIAQRISDTPLLTTLIPKGAFYLFVDISRILGKEARGVKLKNSHDVAKVLLDEYKVAVVPSDAFGMEDYIRISFATSMRDIVEGSNRIERFIKENF